MKAAGNTTRQKILKASARLFSEKGYSGVSIRDLTDAAGVNVASINYHFGGKKNLFREVVRMKVCPIAKETIETLHAIIEGNSPPDIGKLIRAYVSHFMNKALACSTPKRFSRFLSSETLAGGIAADVMVKEFIFPVHKLLRGAIRQARPDLPEEKISLCIMSIVGQILHFVHAREIIKRVMGQGYNKEFIDKVISHITEFSINGLERA